MLSFERILHARIIWCVLACAIAASSRADTTIVSDDFSNSSADPGTAPNASIWTTYNYDPTQYHLGQVNRPTLGGTDYGPQHHDLLGFSGMNDPFYSGPIGGVGIYSNATFKVQDGAVTVNGFIWSPAKTMSNGGDVYVAVTPNGSGMMNLGSFFVREVRAGGGFAQASTISTLSAARFYEYNSAESGRYPAGSSSYSSNAVFGSQLMSDGGFDFSMTLTANGTGVNADVIVTPFGGTSFTLFNGPTQLSSSDNLHLAGFYVQDARYDGPTYIDSIKVTQATGGGSIATVPEPTAAVLCALGMIGLVVMWRTKHVKTNSLKSIALQINSNDALCSSSKRTAQVIALLIVIILVASPCWAVTLVSDEFNNSAHDPGNPPDSSIWTTYNTDPMQYVIGDVHKDVLGGVNTTLGGTDYGVQHHDLLGFAGTDTSVYNHFPPGANSGVGIISNATFEIQNGAVNVNCFMWRPSSSTTGGDVYLAIAQNGSGPLSIGDFFVREVQALTFVQTSSVYNTTDARYYGYNSAESGRYPAGSSSYDSAAVFGSQSVTNSGVNINIALTANGTGVDANVTATAFGGTSITLFNGPTQLSSSANLHVAAFYVQDSATDNPDYFDSINVMQSLPVLVGDFNRDGHVDTKDIQPMELALTNLSSYESTYSVLPADLLGFADVNSDGKFTNADIQSFLTLLKSGGGSNSAVPEPNAFVLALFGLLGTFGSAKLMRKTRSIRV